MSLDDLPKGRWVTGVKQTERAILQGNVLKVYAASDVEDRVIASLRALCLEKEIPFLQVENSALLGKACGIAVKAAAAGVLPWPADLGAGPGRRQPGRGRPVHAARAGTRQPRASHRRARRRLMRFHRRRGWWVAPACRILAAGPACRAG